MFEEAYKDLKSGLKNSLNDCFFEVAVFNGICECKNEYTGKVKDLLIDFARIASCRFDFLNKQNRIKSKKPYIWIMKNQDTCSVKGYYNHIVINFSTLEYIINKCYEVGLNEKFFGELTNNVEINPKTSVFNEGNILLIDELLKYSFSDPLRDSIVYYLIYNSFLFIIDHEICHLSFHKNDMSFIIMDKNRYTRAKEFDADIYATHRCIDNMQENDIFMIHCLPLLNVENKLAELGSIVKAHRMVLGVYSIFLSFLSVGNSEWYTSLDSGNSHPSVPFRFKYIMATIIDRDGLGALEYNGRTYSMSKALIAMAEEFFLNFHNTFPSRQDAEKKLIKHLNTKEADNLFYQLYNDWCCLRTYGAIILG